VPILLRDEEVRRKGAASSTAAKYTATVSPVDRVRAREPDGFWRTRLREFVDLYHRRTDLPRIRDFQVNTDCCSVDEAARQVVEKAGWDSARQDT
jgi:hypothetical protein